MAEIWFSSDLHLNHANMLNFTVTCPTCMSQTKEEADLCPQCGGLRSVKMRPFSNVKEMHECIIEAHNARVKPQDHWWNLGDVTMERNSAATYYFHELVKKFHGHKRLILGNHDHFDVRVYREVFEKVRGFNRLDNFLMSHIPLHPGSIAAGMVNLHGHIHANPTPPGPYINLCVEVLNYAPINLDELRQRAAELLKDVTPSH